LALSLNWTSPTTHVEVLNAYARVVSISVDSLTHVIDLGVGLYASDAAYHTPGTQPFDIYHAWPDYATFLGVSVDVRTASYEYLKTLPAFSGAVDVA
jgi:hypothetical protein